MDSGLLDNNTIAKDKFFQIVYNGFHVSSIALLSALNLLRRLSSDTNVFSANGQVFDFGGSYFSTM